MGKIKCLRCGSPKHTAKACPVQSTLKCNNCGKQGHLAKVCMSKKKEASAPGSSASTAFGFSFAGAAAADTAIANMMVLDCGATDHIICNKTAAHFTDYKKTPDRTVTLADGRKASVDGVGTCYINVENSEGKSQALKLENALHIARWPHTLVSLQCLLPKNNESIAATLTGIRATVKTPTIDLNVLRNSVGLYELLPGPTQLPPPTTAQTPTAMVTHSNADEATLWHRRLGHVNAADLAKLPAHATGIRLAQTVELRF